MKRNRNLHQLGGQNRHKLSETQGLRSVNMDISQLFEKLEVKLKKFLQEHLQQRHFETSLFYLKKTTIKIFQQFEDTQDSTKKIKIQIKPTTSKIRQSCITCDLLTLFEIFLLAEFQIRPFIFERFINGEKLNELQNYKIAPLKNIINDFCKTFKRQLQIYINLTKNKCPSEINFNSDYDEDQDNISKEQKKHYQQSITLLMIRIIIKSYITRFIINVNLSVRTQSFDKNNNKIWGDMMQLYNCIKKEWQDIENFYILQSNKPESVLYNIPIQKSKGLEYFFEREIKDAKTGNQKGYFKSRYLREKQLNAKTTDKLLTNFEQVTNEIHANSNQIKYFEIEDRLFHLENGKITYVLIQNNKLTKYPKKAIINNKSRYIELKWGTYKNSKCLGNIYYLLEKLVNSGDRLQHDLKNLIKQQRTLTKSNELNPSRFFCNKTKKIKKFKNGQFILKHCKDQKKLISEIIDEVLEEGGDQTYMYNIFRLKKDKSTNYKQVRSQAAHGISEELLGFLGYSLKEFKQEFLENGFPQLYSDISDIKEIKKFYIRDIKNNNYLKSFKNNNNYQQKRVPIKINIKNVGTINMTLYPQRTYMNIIDETCYDIIKFFKVKKTELTKQINSLKKQYQILSSIKIKKKSGQLQSVKNQGSTGTSKNGKSTDTSKNSNEGSQKQIINSSQSKSSNSRDLNNSEKSSDKNSNNQATSQELKKSDNFQTTSTKHFKKSLSSKNIVKLQKLYRKDDLSKNNPQKKEKQRPRTCEKDQDSLNVIKNSNSSQDSKKNYFHQQENMIYWNQNILPTNKLIQVYRNSNYSKNNDFYKLEEAQYFSNFYFKQIIKEILLE